MMVLYVSSGRGRKNSKSGTPVDPDTVLEVGDVVRMKGKEWFDSLEKDSLGNGIIQSTGTIVRQILRHIFGMELFVEEAESRNRVPVYRMSYANEKDRETKHIYIGDIEFTNEMLEYI